MLMSLSRQARWGWCGAGCGHWVTVGGTTGGRVARGAGDGRAWTGGRGVSLQPVWRKWLLDWCPQSAAAVCLFWPELGLQPCSTVLCILCDVGRLLSRLWFGLSGIPHCQCRGCSWSQLGGGLGLLLSDLMLPLCLPLDPGGIRVHLWRAAVDAPSLQTSGNARQTTS